MMAPLPRCFMPSGDGLGGEEVRAQIDGVVGVPLGRRIPADFVAIVPRRIVDENLLSRRFFCSARATAASSAETSARSASMKSGARPVSASRRAASASLSARAMSMKATLAPLAGQSPSTRAAPMPETRRR